MEVILSDIGKRFNSQWIFKGITHTFLPNSISALTGNNGSGKSTLLQIIYGFQTYSRGKISWELNNESLIDETLPGKISLAAPYLELPEEFTLEEMLRFHFSIVPPKTANSKEEMLKSAGLAGQEQKFIKHFSSGMKQRLKLLLAFYSNSPLLLLDEPCSNLDENGINWYRNILEANIGQRTIIIASNQTFEYQGCQSIINVSQFRP